MKETSSTKTASSVSSSNQPIRMSSDTSTSSVKKKKTSTRSMMKHLIGVVSQLSSKVNLVLQKKDKPNKRFSGEDMVNVEEEEPYNHGPEMNFDDTCVYGLEKEFVPTATGHVVDPSPEIVQLDEKAVTPIGTP
ncbi:unnamed protein product [Lactuca virosa]|uniref:Uncharacterized protein n=1 Tax=Lactuca virosa TaxID=75947 RepID=A0AAU9PE48_9ASTR|nr:unnamed protein product [Lactuca virosa]